MLAPNRHLSALPVIGLALALIAACAETTTKDPNLMFAQALSYTVAAGTSTTAVAVGAAVAGDSLTMAVVVGNDGTSDSGSFVIQVSDAVTVSGVTTADPNPKTATISSVAAKSQMSIPFAYPYNGSTTWAALVAGNHLVAVKLDSTKAVSETSEDDNQQTIAIVLPKVNATVTQPADGATTGPGATVSFSAALASDGITSVTNRPVRWVIKRVSSGAVVDEGTVNLSGGAAAVPIDATVPRQGLNGAAAYQVIIDPDGTLPELLIDGGDGDNTRSFAIDWQTASV